MNASTQVPDLDGPSRRSPLTAAEKTPIASWSFDPGSAGDEVRGFQKIVDGVAGQALRFDGQTTAVVRPAAKMPRIGGAFSVEAWVALQTYPWTWCAIANQEKDRRAGYFFGVDPEGRFGLQVAVGRRMARMPIGRRPAALCLEPYPRHLRSGRRTETLPERQAGRREGRAGPARLRSRGRCLDRTQPDASRSHRGDPGRRARWRSRSTGSSTRSGSTTPPSLPPRPKRPRRG
ncbi:MAG: LamG domain-containing protein [Candidatus Moduliflexus flocculans]|nr:LamG domain-containing protein [Candidatus Moduliflexus flocculans]